MKYLPGAIVVWLLACIWLLPPVQAQFRPQLCNLGDSGFCSRLATIACTAPTIDPNVAAVTFSDWVSGMTFVLPAISSTGSNVVVVIFLETNGLSSTGTIAPTDTAGLTYGVSSSLGGLWNGTNRLATDTSSSYSEFVGKSSSALSSDVITITYNQLPTFATAQVFIVDGTKFSAPFDPNGSLPSGVPNSAVINVATTSPCTMVINSVAETGTATPTLPWVQVLQRNFMFTQYARFTSAQPLFTIPSGGGTYAKGIGDALQSP